MELRSQTILLPWLRQCTESEMFYTREEVAGPNIPWQNWCLGDWITQKFLNVCKNIVRRWIQKQFCLSCIIWSRYYNEMHLIMWIVTYYAMQLLCVCHHITESFEQRRHLVKQSALFSPVMKCLFVEMNPRNSTLDNSHNWRMVMQHPAIGYWFNFSCQLINQTLI